MCGYPNRLLLQFHITGRCNLRCKHCYREEGDVEPLTYDQVIGVIDQFKELTASYNALYGMHKKAHINITGGEPFIRADVLSVLKYLGEQKDWLSYGVLSNGSFIDERVIAALKETEVSFVQLSIDGDSATHDALRAPGDYERVFQTAKRLEEHGVCTYISFTANRENMKHFPHVAKECRRKHITKLWTDRLVPIGGGAALQELALRKEDMKAYYRLIRKAQGHAFTHWRYPKTVVSSNRALQFLGTKGQVYSCNAGKGLITVTEFGEILPCRRMPIPCGNVTDTTLSDVYWEHPVFRQLRGIDRPKECASCAFAYLCRGGAKCQSYAQYGSFYRADPACTLCDASAKEGKDECVV